MRAWVRCKLYVECKSFTSDQISFSYAILLFYFRFSLISHLFSLAMFSCVQKRFGVHQFQKIDSQNSNDSFNGVDMSYSIQINTTVRSMLLLMIVKLFNQPLVHIVLFRMRIKYEWMMFLISMRTEVMIFLNKE